MKVIVTTSDKYLHILSVFFHLFEKNWGGKIELVGYTKPDNLPDWVTFVSLGVQRGPAFFSDDLKPYFAKQDKHFIWLFEDSFIKSVDFAALVMAERVVNRARMIGKFCLTNESMHRGHTEDKMFFYVDQEAEYRLSTQPAIWNREFLLEYLKPGLSPWTFETQVSINDNWRITGFVENVVKHNEGIRKNDLNAFGLSGFDDETLKEINEIQHRSRADNP